MSAFRFPSGFLWGFATSAFQVEGAPREMGRGESIWDRFAARPGAIADGSDARVACDHFRRWRGDVKLMERLGAGAYRFSIAWPRALPEGRGRANQKGLDFYDELVDLLLAAGIRPFATLYHWDLPQALQREGGWAARSTAEAFARYAEVVWRRLGDRVRDWTTHNEPWCIATLGHERGEHAPGHHNPAEALVVAHHVLLSHGWAVEALRRLDPGARIGISLNLVPAWPASSSAADRDAARRFDGAFNRWYLDPLFLGRYPLDAVADRVADGHLRDPSMPFVLPGDLDAIAAPLDFLGINYYTREIVRAPVLGQSPPLAVGERTEMGWEVYPAGLYEILTRVHREYRPLAILVTENGAAFPDAPDASGRVRDPRRIEYLRGHLCAAHRALEEGVPLAGYFLWSLLDNFEWAHGYTKRFGAVYVDYATQKRIPKDSAYWYRDVIAANGVEDDLEDALERRSPCAPVEFPPADF